MRQKMLNETIKENLEQYLSTLHNAQVRVQSIVEIGNTKNRELKTFGYGKPYRVTFSLNQEIRSAVLETMLENSFGHDHFSDRAQILLWGNSTYNNLPGHVRSMDVGAFTREKRLLSLGEAEEFFLLTEFVEGQEYAADLQRILSTGQLEPRDLERAAALADYLVRIHQARMDAPQLYRRRIRDLIGHGECIMGLVDNYPAGDAVASQERLQKIEQQCLRWRWKIRNMSHRLCQVHGDFHPWNILFRKDIDFTVLDRSRGEWGEAADDVGALVINYVFLALQKFGSLTGPFESLYRLFWKSYLDGTRDTEILKVIQPFLAWRGLVLSNPVWYPTLSEEVRQKIFHLIENVLAVETFKPEDVNEYLS